MDDDRRYLAPVLSPYLNSLFAASHQNGWHLEECRRRLSDHAEEMRVLGSYCNLVAESEVNATGALMDAVNKGWVWAENMLDTADYLMQSDVTGQPEVGLQLLLTPAEGEVIRRSVAVPSSRGELQLPDSRYSTFSSTKSTYSRCTGTVNAKKALSLRPTSVTLPIMLAQHHGNNISKGKHPNWSYTVCNGAEWTKLSQDRKQNTVNYFGFNKMQRIFFYQMGNICGFRRNMACVIS
jgi:hypothetical protein